MKISKQTTNEKRKAKYELGNFCEQYGMPPIAPSRRNKLKPTKQKTHNKFTRKTKHNNDPFYSKTNKSRKNTKPSQKKTPTNSKSNDKCFKCGKFGYHAKDCKVKTQIKSLDLTSEIIKNILKHYFFRRGATVILLVQSKEKD